MSGATGFRARPMPRRDQAGFTLIELLLATGLIALIMAMAYGGFRAGIRATASGEALIEETNRLRVVHQFVRNQMTQARALVIEDIDGERILFEGDAERIRFVAPMPGYLSYGGPYVQELRLERGEVGVDLVFAFAMLNGYEPGDLEADPPVTLLEDVGGAEFEFLGFDESGEEVRWARVWETPSELPLAVSLMLGFERDTGLRWPGLTAPVMIDNAGGVMRARSVDDVRANILGGSRPRNRQ
ncbi:MAG: prepilin-type N-terminal cleavage/methylation domain-containing protein [Wenzhouxiangellaceae bacterium]